jgi:hypothetical protein
MAVAAMLLNVKQDDLPHPEAHFSQFVKKVRVIHVHTCDDTCDDTCRIRCMMNAINAMNR